MEVGKVRVLVRHSEEGGRRTDDDRLLLQDFVQVDEWRGRVFLTFCAVGEASRFTIEGNRR